MKKHVNPEILRLQKVNKEIRETSLIDNVKMLRDYGWNVIPLFYIKRKQDGKKDVKFISNYQKYHERKAPLELFKRVHKNFAIITGKTSNLTIVDLDSEAAVQSVEKLLDCDISKAANYVVKSAKGYHLFYKYIPGLRVRHLKELNIDILSDGAVTFGDPYNDGYELIADNPDLGDMPEELKAALLEGDEDYQESDEDYNALMSAIKSNEDLPYRYPMYYTIKAFLEKEKLFPKLKEELKRIFCTKQYKGYNLSDFAKAGAQSAEIVYCGSLVAASPTVDEEMYRAFMRKWTETICKLDLNASCRTNNRKTEEDLMKERIKQNMKFFYYDSDWQEKYKSIQKDDFEDTNYLRKYNISVWYDLVEKEYCWYDQIGKCVHTQKIFNQLQIDLAAHILDIKADHDEITNEDLKDFKKNLDPQKIPRRTKGFNPNINSLFYTEENEDSSVQCYNQFERPHLLNLYQQRVHKFKTHKPHQLKIPKHIDALLSNVIPEDKMKHRFLNDLAIHMRDLRTARQCYIFIDEKGGAGKSMILNEILSVIYSDKYTFLTDAASVKGRFRQSLKNKLVIAIDEIDERNAERGDRGSFYSFIKTFISNDKVNLEGKGTEENNTSNYGFYMGFSNQPIPFKIDDKNDRRCNFVKTSGKNLLETDIMKEVGSYDDFSDKVKTELMDFIDYLAALDVKYSDYPLENDLRTKIFKLSRTTEDMIEIMLNTHNTSDCYMEDLADLMDDLYDSGEKCVGIEECKDRLRDYNKLRKIFSNLGVKQVRYNGERAWELNPNGYCIASEFEDITEDDFLL